MPCFGSVFNHVPQQGPSWKKLFKQKSGVLGVMHNLTKRNRLVSKHGRINAYTRWEFVVLKY